MEKNFVIMESHTQVPVKVCCGIDALEEEVNVDVYIAPLIAKLNEKHLYTEYSCSGHEEEAFVGFYVMLSGVHDKNYNENIEKFKKIIDDIDELCIEYDYAVWSYDDNQVMSTQKHVYLTDPTKEEKDLARRLIFGNDFVNDKDYDPDDVYENESLRIIIRLTETKTNNIFYHVTSENFNEVALKNCEKYRSIVLNAVDKLVKALDENF